MTTFNEEWLAQYERKLRQPPTSDSLTMILPAPPSVNTMFRNVPGKGRVKTDDYKTWLEAAAPEVTRQIGVATIKGKYRSTIHISSGADIDNVPKAVHDLLKTMGVTADDKHLAELHVYRDAGPRGIKVTIDRLDP